MTRLGVVVNPTADRGRADRVGARVHARLRERGVEVVELSGATFADSLARARAAVAGEHGDLDGLVVVGGDGMVHLGVNAVAGTSTPLGIVAAGSGNDFARALGLPVRDPDGAVATILRTLELGGRTVDAARVRALEGGHVEGGTERWFCGVLSAGLDAAVNARANGMRRPRGRAKYAVAALAELRRFVPFGYRVTSDGTVWESPGTLVAVANGPAIGGGIRIAPDARVDDGLLDVVLAGPLSRAAAARVFPLTYAGRHVAHPAVTVAPATVVRVEATSDGAQPPPAFADGEAVGTLPLEVRVEPGALRVLS
ncbi:diacylglycerol/lipid kinase family protein [Luteimicrobium subarcticum]|uniref:Diacylglycerol kinase (ATP) n=1 Tax=Luteimicrobium subarcticum TaxID=620910 RepID=A0A2M8W3Q6_9MICO|nr:diacylglycerol kinase family protein [Luteimicrobium subarcticum]PJI85562.1 diacylglycerol kinase (ATP) [Luteimicrobium subarcticum]